MTPEKRFSLDLDTVAGLLVSFFFLLIALVIFVGSQIGVRVTARFSGDTPIGPYEVLTFDFSEPVDESLALEKFFIQPEVNGSFRWEDERTLQFVPREPFQPDTVYTVALAPGPVTTRNRSIKRPMSWKFSIRQPLIVYMTSDAESSRLWTLNPVSGKSSILLDEPFKIYDFDTSRSGEFVVFSAFNEQNGIDLWHLGRGEEAASLLLDCGPDRCTLPAVSPNGRQVAYVREAAGPDQLYGAPRIWVLDIEKQQNAPLYEDQQIIGNKPVWSPDSTRLSSFDGLADEIRLLDLITGNQLTIPSQTGGPVTWSPDGDTFVFTDLATNESGVYTRIRQAKLITQEIITLIGEGDTRDYHYSSLAWSPGGSRLLIGLRLDANHPGDALWLVDPVTLGGQVIADAPDQIYSNPQWDPWGNVLVFQQFKLKEVYRPEIGLWMSGFEEPRVLGEGMMPRWLP